MSMGSEDRFGLVLSARASTTSVLALHSDSIDIFLLREPCPLEMTSFDELHEYLGELQAGRIPAWGVAVAERMCIALQAALTAPTIAQYHKDVFSARTIQEGCELTSAMPPPLRA